MISDYCKNSQIAYLCIRLKSNETNRFGEQKSNTKRCRVQKEDSNTRKGEKRFDRLYKIVSRLI